MAGFKVVDIYCPFFGQSERGADGFLAVGFQWVITPDNQSSTYQSMAGFNVVDIVVRFFGQPEGLEPNSFCCWVLTGYHPVTSPPVINHPITGQEASFYVVDIFWFPFIGQ